MGPRGRGEAKREGGRSASRELASEGEETEGLTISFGEKLRASIEDRLTLKDGLKKEGVVVDGQGEGREGRIW